AHCAVVFTDGDFPVVAEDKAVSRVEEGQRAALTRINRVQDAFEAGSLIDRLTKGVSSRELQAVGEALFQGDLERVVGGVGDGVLRKNAGEHRDAACRASRTGHGVAKWRRVAAQAH